MCGNVNLEEATIFRSRGRSLLGPLKTTLEATDAIERHLCYVVMIRKVLDRSGLAPVKSGLLDAIVRKPSDMAIKL